MKHRIKTTMLGLIAAVCALCMLPTPSFAGSYGTQTEAHTDIAYVGGLPTPNTVTCKTWIVSVSELYPADDDHYWVCSSTLHPTVNATRADLAVAAVQALNSNALLYDFLETAKTTATTTKIGISYYYFPTRDDANLFMRGKFPGGLSAGAGGTVNLDSRCGNTGTPTDSSQVISQIYETCSFGGSIGNVLNPDPRKTGAHETGHAFDFAYGLQYGGGVPISASVGFKCLAGGTGCPTQAYAGDIALIKPTDWNATGTGALTATQKASYICSIFRVNLNPSLFEQSTGVFNESVCSNSSTVRNNTGLTPPGHNFTSMDPRQILDLRVPYFVSTGPGAGPLYAELFAEEFASRFQPYGFLEMTDYALADKGGAPCKTTAGVYSCNGGDYAHAVGFYCTKWVVRQYFVTVAPPPAYPDASSMRGRGCPDISPSLLK